MTIRPVGNHDAGVDFFTEANGLSLFEEVAIACALLDESLKQINALDYLIKVSEYDNLPVKIYSKIILGLKDAIKNIDSQDCKERAFNALCDLKRCNFNDTDGIIFNLVCGFRESIQHISNQSDKILALDCLIELNIKVSDKECYEHIILGLKYAIECINDQKEKIKAFDALDALTLRKQKYSSVGVNALALGAYSAMNHIDDESEKMRAFQRLVGIIIVRALNFDNNSEIVDIMLSIINDESKRKYHFKFFFLMDAIVDRFNREAFCILIARVFCKYIDRINDDWFRMRTLRILKKIKEKKHFSNYYKLLMASLWSDLTLSDLDANLL